MKFRIIVVGKIRDPHLSALVSEYERRAARYWPVEFSEVRDDSSRSADEVRVREGERLGARAADSLLIVCDERGEAMTSTAFAEWMQRLREEARDVSFLIGGAHGLDPALRARAQRALLLAPWTLPHEMARLVLAEQLYRAGTIVRREPYHK